MVRAQAVRGELLSKRGAMIAVLGAMALVVLDGGMMNVAVPEIARSFGVSAEAAIGTVTVYQGTIVAGLLPCAHLAPRFGERRLFVTGLALFTLASLACTIAGELWVLLAARALQGGGAAAIMALGIAILRTVFGDRQLGAAIAANAMTVALCSAAAPVAGALVLSLAPWPWLFLTKLPLAAVALGAAFMIPSYRPEPRPIDKTGLPLHVVTVVLCAVAMAMPARLPTFSFLAIAAALMTGVVLLLRLRSSRNPIWPIDLLALPPLRVAAAASVCCFVAQSAGILALSFQLQTVLGAGPLASGLVMSCWPVTVAFTSALANRAAERVGSPILCVIGGASLGAGLLLSAVPMGESLASVVVGAVVSGLGFGLFQVPNNRTMFLSAPADRSAAAGGLQGTARLLGQTLGALLIGHLFINFSDAIAPRLGLVLGALLALGAACVSGLGMARTGRTLAEGK